MHVCVHPPQVSFPLSVEGKARASEPGLSSEGELAKDVLTERRARASEPSASEASAPEPSAPEPSAPEPSASEPSASEPSMSCRSRVPPHAAENAQQRCRPRTLAAELASKPRE